MPCEEPKAIRSKRSKALRTPEESKEMSDSTHIAKAFHSPLLLKKFVRIEATAT
jgi:hypothetical protein